MRVTQLNSVGLVGVSRRLAPSGSSLLALSKLVIAKPSCRMLFRHDERRADSRAAWTAGSSRATRMPMIAITTSSSTRVNPRRLPPRVDGVEETERRSWQEDINLTQGCERTERVSFCALATRETIGIGVPGSKYFLQRDRRFPRLSASASTSSPPFPDGGRLERGLWPAWSSQRSGGPVDKIYRLFWSESLEIAFDSRVRMSRLRRSSVRVAHRPGAPLMLCDRSRARARPR